MADEDYSAFVSEETISPDKLDTLRALCLEMLQADSEVVRLTEELAKATAKSRRLHEREIPDLMEACHCTEHHYVDPTTGAQAVIKIGEEVRVTLPKAKRDEGYDWLEENGLEAIIQQSIETSVGVGREAFSKADEIVKAIKAYDPKLACKFNRDVHPSTLRAQIIKAIEKGLNVPNDVFSVYRQRTAQVSLS
jgi:hypothetical protein